MVLILEQIGDPVKLLAILIHYLLRLEMLMDVLPSTLRDKDLVASCYVFFLISVFMLLM